MSFTKKNLGGIMTTSTMKAFDLVNPSEQMINIEDIATGLSNICRFGGQVKQFYSVAQHCCLLSMIVPQDIRLEALMDDSTEAYMGDVHAPLKQLLPEYKVLEHNLMTKIAAKYKLDLKAKTTIEPLDSKLCDMEYNYLHEIERMELYQLVDKNFVGYPVIWSPLQAKNTFITLFNNYTRAVLYTIIFTKQDNTTVDQDIKANTRLEAAQKAQQILSENEFKDWYFADAPHRSMGTL